MRCTRDPFVMLYLAAELRDVVNKFLNGRRKLFVADVIFLEWARRQPYFKNKEAKAAINGIESHLRDGEDPRMEFSKMLYRLKRSKLIDYSSYQKVKTWFITAEGKLLLIDLTTVIRRIAGEVVKRSATPKPIRKRKPKYD